MNKWYIVGASHTMPGTATATPIQRSQARLPRSDRAEQSRAGSDLKPVPAESPIPPHDDAVRRLEGALAEQGRRRRQYEAAFETSDEPSAYVRLCEANERVATRARWLEWVDQRWDRGRSAHIAPGTRAGDRLHVRWGEQSGR